MKRRPGRAVSCAHGSSNSPAIRQRMIKIDGFPYFLYENIRIEVVFEFSEGIE